MPLKKEQITHINVVNWFNWTFPDLSDDLHHFANERRCSIQQGRTLKRMGVKKGVSDFFLAYPINGKCGLWVELKEGSKVTKEQLEFGERKRSRGYDFSVTYGFEATKECILAYLQGYNSKSINNIGCN